MEKTLAARELVRTLTQPELEALRNIAAGGSVRDFAKSFAVDITAAAEVMNSMRAKLRVLRDADAVRIALCADISS